MPKPKESTRETGRDRDFLAIIVYGIDVREGRKPRRRRRALAYLTDELPLLPPYMRLSDNQA